MNVTTIDGYSAKIEYDPELDMFRGEIQVQFANLARAA